MLKNCNLQLKAQVAKNNNTGSSPELQEPGCITSKHKLLWAQEAGYNYKCSKGNNIIGLAAILKVVTLQVFCYVLTTQYSSNLLSSYVSWNL